MKSNTAILMDNFLAGFEKESGNSHETLYLVCDADRARAKSLFRESDMVLLAFPLYNDAMPSIVKEFIESLAPYQGKEGNPTLLFLVQCGFLGGSNTTPIAAYLKKLADRLGCLCAGVIRKDGVEGIQGKPRLLNRRLFTAMYKLGYELGSTGHIEERGLQLLAQPENYSQLTLKIFNKLAEYVYWKPLYKRNGTYVRRFDRPYDVV
jgi:hypothetical protein